MFATASRVDDVDAAVGIAELRDHLGTYINRVHYCGATVTVHRNGRPYAVLMSAAEYARLRAAATPITEAA